MICPLHFVDWNFFSSNIKSWFDELPLRRLLVGCNNPDPDIFNVLQDYVSRFDHVEFIDHRKQILTLGKQIADLMERVETEWFVYVHGDAELTPFCFKIMEAYMNNERVGIVESERVQYDGKTPKRTYWNYHFVPRSFSGFQLIRKAAIEAILPKIEDDYIYRNEDIIFQNACEVAGYEYVKAWAMHIHNATDINAKWTPKGEYNDDFRLLTYDMQTKGIVKYCTPNDITVKAWIDAFGVCYREHVTTLFDFIDFVRQVNPVWEEAIINKIMEFYR